MAEFCAAHHLPAALAADEPAAECRNTDVSEVCGAMERRVVPDDSPSNDPLLELIAPAGPLHEQSVVEADFFILFLR